MSNHRNEQRDQVLKQLAERFEKSSQHGKAIFLTQEEFEDLLSFYFGFEDFDTALAVADMAIAQYRFTPEFYKWKALLHKINAQEEAALQALDVLATYAPADVEALILRLEVLVHFHLRDQAYQTIEELNDLVDTDEHKSGLCYYKGVLYLAEGNIKSAFRELCTSIRLDPEQEAALAEIVENTVFHDRINKLIPLLQQLLEEDPFNDLLWFYLGLAHNIQQDEAASLNALEYALALNEDRADYAVELADRLFDLERYPDCLIAYERFLQMPEAELGYETCMRMGCAQQKLEQNEQAKFYFQKATELAPNMFDGFSHLAECYMEEEQWKKAIRCYEKAVRCRHFTSDCWLGLAHCYIAIEEIDQAEEAFEKAIEMPDNASQSYVVYALFLIAENRQEEALEIIEEAKEKYQDPTIAYGTVAVYLAANRRRTALIYLVEALSAYYDEHSFLLEWNPDLAEDPEIAAMLLLYK